MSSITAAPQSLSTPTATDWWRHAVTYQVYLRSFADGDGDGMGDIAGIRSRLGYLADLGVDALWINPWYPSPQADAGYDVSNYRDIEPVFGTRDEAEALIAEAHALGIRVLLDVVPNHTSDEHPWFVEALASAPGSPERERYIFRDGSGPDGAAPPNDWLSVFGGTAWQKVDDATRRPGEPAQWYLHLFDTKQPDLNWDNPAVRAEFEDILRFWFDRGADGFRIDVAHGLIKDPALPNLDGRSTIPMLEPAGQAPHLLDAADRADHPHWDRPGVHEIYRSWRAVADGFADRPNGAPIFVAEAWVASPERLAHYLRPDELHTAFDFDFVMSPWNAEALRRTATASLAAHDTVGAPVMWVLSNHDVTRHVTRLGRAGAHRDEDPLHGHDAEPSDLALGRRRARAALLLELSLPGGVYLYQGEELGLEEVDDLPAELRQDPVWLRSNGAERGRDGCRVPLPWTPDGPSLGFGTAPGWLPQPAEWAGPDGLSAQVQQADPASMLTFYRTALRLRRDLVTTGHLGAGSPTASGGRALTWVETAGEAATANLVAFRRRGEANTAGGTDSTATGFACVVNVGREPSDLPDELIGARVLLASAPLPLAAGGTWDVVAPGTQLPGDTAVWLALD
ncbi:MAG: glycoside hydrolase family 13 protein [Kineosporiaceae bacterium]